MSQDLAAEDQVLHVPSESTKVFTDDKKHPSPHREGRKFQVINDHTTRLAKISSNDKLPVNTRIEKLTQLAKYYADGTPFKKNAVLMALNVDGVPILSRIAKGMADQLFSIEKQRAGGGRDSDHGKMGNQ